MLVTALLAGGCSDLSGYRASERLAQGYTIVLPGIEGRSWINTSLVKGLADGGVPTAIEVYDWTAAGWLSVPVNLRGQERNRRQGRKIARRIMEYQDKYPGKPVHLIGHSGGGGVAVYALEALPANRQITAAILLGPALAPDYDLCRALKRTRLGIWNYYSPYDVGFLRAGTTVMGTVDGRHTSAAGAVSFAQPWGLDEEDRRLYGSKLHQQGYTPKMADSGHRGRHTHWAKRSFVAEWLAPVLLSHLQDQAHYAADMGDHADTDPALGADAYDTPAK